MEDQNERIIILLNLFAEDRINRKELVELLGYISDSTHNEPLHSFMLSEWESIDTSKPFPEPDWTAMLNTITHSPKRNIPVYKRMWPRIAVAASLLFAIGIPLYLVLHKKPGQQTAQNSEQIAPVQNSVVLTLANGQKIVLNKKHSGQIADINGTQINQQDSLLNYQGKVATEVVKMNTLSNNGSDKFSVTLTDGTVAVLDIGSSLTYPSSFGSGTRKVSMAGQAYFKVKHIAGQAFVVAYKDQTAEDIGTEFNINAYADEPAVRTTLIEGSIRVNGEGKNVILKPGQQAIAGLAGEGLSVRTVNLEDVTAWLQRQLVFHNETLENIMRNVARIYNVTIVWQDQDVRKLTFGGSVTRNEKLATVLNYFRKAGGVDFIVQGKTVKVFKPKK